MLLITVLSTFIRLPLCAQNSVDSHGDWDSALKAASERATLAGSERFWESYTSDRKKGVSINRSRNSVEILPGGYKFSSSSEAEDSSMETDRQLHIKQKRQSYTDSEWQERLGWERMESRWTGEVWEWKQYLGENLKDEGVTRPGRNSLDISLLVPALELLVNSGRRNSLEVSLPMGKMNPGIRLSFRETDTPATVNTRYRFPDGWKPPEGIKGILVEMELTGAASLIYRHRQYFFFTPEKDNSDQGRLILVHAWGGDPSWPSIQRPYTP